MNKDIATKAATLHLTLRNSLGRGDSSPYTEGSLFCEKYKLPSPEPSWVTYAPELWLSRKQLLDSDT